MVFFKVWVVKIGGEKERWCVGVRGEGVFVGLGSI